MGTQDKWEGYLTSEEANKQAIIEFGITEEMYPLPEEPPVEPNEIQRKKIGEKAVAYDGCAYVRKYYRRSFLGISWSDVYYIDEIVGCV